MSHSSDVIRLFLSLQQNRKVGNRTRVGVPCNKLTHNRGQGGTPPPSQWRRHGGEGRGSPQPQSKPSLRSLQNLIVWKRGGEGAGGSAQLAEWQHCVTASRLYLMIPATSQQKNALNSTAYKDTFSQPVNVSESSKIRFQHHFCDVSS